MEQTRNYADLEPKDRNHTTLTDRELQNMRKPEHLNKRAHGYYERLEKILNGKLKEGDENLLAVLANCYVFYNDYQNDLMGGVWLLRDSPKKPLKKWMRLWRLWCRMVESISIITGLPKPIMRFLLAGED